MDLHVLPKVRDGLSYLYVEHARVDQHERAIALHDAAGTTPVPCAALSLLMLGPGTAVTHAAVRVLAESGCLVAWVGEEGVRFYAQGLGETRSSRGLLQQARLVSDPAARLRVVRRMYTMRFREHDLDGLTLEQIRGREGIRVRTAYQRASREFGVPWRGRAFQAGDWRAADPVNRALSTANACLYGVCHAAVVAAGFSPALGFVHTGKALSFVYDVADLYKTETTIPAALRATAEGTEGLEGRVRHACRDAFRESRLLARVVDDVKRLLELDRGAGAWADDADFDAEPTAPGALWDPDGEVAGGRNHADPADDGAGRGEEDGP